MTFVYARGIWSVKHSHSHSHSRLNHLPHSPYSFRVSVPAPAPSLSLLAEQPPQPRQAVSKCKPNRSLDRLWDCLPRREGDLAQWISIGFSSVFGLSMHVAICTTDASRCPRTACGFYFFGLSIRKLNFLGAFLINAAKCRRARSWLPLCFWLIIWQSKNSIENRQRLSPESY